MDNELRLSLLFIGACFIVAVLVHGMWKIRKNATIAQKQRVEPIDPNLDTDTETDTSNGNSSGVCDEELDALGLGEVRVISEATPTLPVSEDALLDESQETVVEAQLTSLDDIPAIDEQDDVGTSSADSADDEISTEATPEPKLYGSVVSNPKPHIRDKQAMYTAPSEDNAGFPEPPSYLLQDDAPQEPVTPAEKVNTDEPSFSLDSQAISEPKQAPVEPQSVSEKAKRFVKGKRSKSTSRDRMEPKLGDDQMNMFDEPESEKPASTQTNTNNTGALEQEVLVLNVRATEGNDIPGAALLPMLLTLGFKFGDQDIFHRHVNANGKGPVLFSLANMFKPGVFDIDNLENFTTQGLSLFMILPIEGDPHQVFNMMHNAARKLADEFGAQVLDGRRSVLTKQGLQQYMEKIREFERKRMISRS